MSNHVHLVIEIAEPPLHKTVHHFATRYAKAFNKRHGREGHLFYRRHQAKLVADNAYFVSLLRYVHRNPIEARLVEFATDYCWSSMRAYLGLETIDWLATERGLGLLHASFGDARKSLIDLVGRADIDFDPWSPETGGAEGPTIAGEFCASTVGELIDAGCRQFSVTEAQLRSRSRSKQVVSARLWIATEAERRGIASVSAIARRVGRTRAALSLALKRHHLEESQVTNDSCQTKPAQFDKLDTRHRVRRRSRR